MNSFEFFSVQQIVFGVGQFKRVGELAASLGRRLLVVHNGNPSTAEKLECALRAAGLHVERIRQSGEPTVDSVNSALERARSADCDSVIGLGGGSAIDAAKAVAALLTNGGSSLDYMEVVGRGQKIVKPAAPWMAIPTTAGAGAEATRNAVVLAPEQKFKASIRGAQLLARIALIDPELAVTNPPAVTAASGMDAICQCIEAYTSSGANAMTDPLAFQGFKLGARSISRAVSDGANLEARSDMAMSALLSGMALSGAGLGAVHGFAAPLGANYPAPHGVICAALLPYVIEANLSAATRDETGLGRALWSRYAELGRLIPERRPGDESEQAMRVLDSARRLVHELNIPRLGTYGLTPEAVPGMVALAKKASSMKYNPITLSEDVLASVLMKAL